ncbi:hypothetical protein GCM10023323_34700 [Streptomyces thinghirensis]|uniref:Transposase n=1 Tax=Streptomyces thinghirensis TaxID=551547 RepID=A0ABP9T2W3_9ACTN
MPNAGRTLRYAGIAAYVVLVSAWFARVNEKRSIPRNEAVDERLVDRISLWRTGLEASRALVCPQESSARESYPQAVRKICGLAEVIIPNS